MTILSDGVRQAWARMMVVLFVTATLLMAVASGADAAPRSKCRNNPENFSFYKGKCLSDKRIEFLKERRHGPNHD